MTNELTKGNITTIATWLAILLTIILTQLGIEIDQGMLVSFCSGLITLCIAIYSSKHPNTFEFLGNQDDTEVIDEKDNEDTIEDLTNKYQTDDTIDTEVDTDGV